MEINKLIEDKKLLELWFKDLFDNIIEISSKAKERLVDGETVKPQIISYQIEQLKVIPPKDHYTIYLSQYQNYVYEVELEIRFTYLKRSSQHNKKIRLNLKIPKSITGNLIFYSKEGSVPRLRNIINVAVYNPPIKFWTSNNRSGYCEKIYLPDTRRVIDIENGYLYTLRYEHWSLDNYLAYYKITKDEAFELLGEREYLYEYEYSEDFHKQVVKDIKGSDDPEMWKIIVSSRFYQKLMFDLKKPIDKKYTELEYFELTRDMFIDLLTLAKNEEFILKENGEERLTPLNLKVFSAMDGLKEYFNLQCYVYGGSSLPYRIWRRLVDNNTNLNSIFQKIIDKFFTINSGKETFSIEGVLNQIQEVLDYNPVSIISQSNKIYVFNKSNGIKIPIDYTKALVGIVCPVRTPENNNVNILNELSEHCKIKNNTFYVSVLDKNLNEVDLSYLEYFSSRILLNEYFDENLKRVVPIDGKISYLQYGEYHYTENKDEYDYISKGILSKTASLIPFINKSDTIRISMGSSMITQAIPIKNPSKEIVSTPSNIETDVGIVKSEYDGKVKHIGKFSVVISTKSRDVEIYKPPSKKTLNNTYVVWELSKNIKEGKPIKRGDIIYKISSITDEGEVRFFKSVRVAYMDYYGYTSEDGVVISKKLADDLSTPLEEVVEIVYTKFQKYKKPTDDKNLKQKWNDKRFDPYGLIKVGSRVKMNDILVYKVISHTSKSGSEISVFKYERVPMVVDEGIVDQIYIEYHEDPENSDTYDLIEQMWNYYENLPEDYPLYLYNHNDNPEENITIKIKIHIVGYNKCKVGDKIASKYGVKGVITKILDKMPYDDQGEFDILVNPVSLISRKTPSQIYESKLSNISKIAFSINDELLKNNNRQEFLSNMRLLYKVEDMTEKEALDLHLQASRERYYTIKVKPIDLKYTEEYLQKLEDHFNAHSKKQVYLPDGRLIKNPVETGYISLMRLYILPELKAKITPSKVLKRRDLEELYGKVKLKQEGQKFGEMELWALYAYGNINKVLKNLEVPRNKTISEIQKELLQMGLNLKVVLEE